MSETPLITLKNVGCRYRFRKGYFKFSTYEALKDINLTINRGETLGVLGRNGAGKSTLLKLVAGIIKPDTGSIHYHRKVSISLLTLQLGFSNELTGRDNAIMGAMLLGCPKSEALEKLDGIKEFSELGTWFDEPIKSYSSGMRARLGFSVALEVCPDILLVDEVLGVGDEAFRKKSAQAMKAKMESGQTVLFVSHSLEAIQQLCPRSMWIEDGVTHMFGDTNDVLAAYREHMNRSSELKG